MATFQSFEAFGRAIGDLERDIDRQSRTYIAGLMAARAESIARTAASSDLGGDPKFSGWAPALDTKIRWTRDGVIMSPTRSSAGPWTVAERGRNQGNAAGFAGPGINRRTGITSRTNSGGLRKVRAFRAKRWNGRTRGKGTASDATATMDRELPQIAEREVRRVTVKHFDVTG